MVEAVVAGGDGVEEDWTLAAAAASVGFVGGAGAGVDGGCWHRQARCLSCATMAIMRSAVKVSSSIGDVVDDVGVADADGEDEGAGAAAVLLVLGGEGDEVGGVGLEALERAVGDG